MSRGAESLLPDRWHQGWSDHARHLRRARRKPAPGEIHALRVNARRLLAQLDVLRRAAPGRRRVQRLRRRLRRLLRITGPARDAWLQRRLLPARGDRPDPGWHHLSRYFERRYRRRRKRLATALARHPARPRIPRFPLRRPAPAGTLAAARAAAERRVLDRLPAAARMTPAANHRLRVAFKKLRYQLELHPPGRGAPEIAVLQRAQSALGDLHDFDVWLATLRRRARRHRPAARWLRSHARDLAARRRALASVAAALTRRHARRVPRPAPARGETLP